MKEDLNKRRGILFLRIGKEMKIMSLFPKLIYRFNVIPIKIPLVLY